MTKFTALVARQEVSETGHKGQLVRLENLDLSQLPAAEVLVEVSFSSLNYKDALAITGRAPIVRSYPMVLGIDFAGHVRESSHPDFMPGDEVIATGCGLGEDHWGGLSQLARVPAAWLVHRPALFTPRQCMAIGTAGFTAMQCALAIKRHGVTPEQGEIVVTGAAGGVGSVAVALLSSMGYKVVALTRRMAEQGYLRSLGAHRVLDAATLEAAGKPLSKELWAGAVDTVGSHILANVCASIKSGGAVAACGLAAGVDLPLTVMPFILRGIALYGINSVTVAPQDRQAIWQSLQRHLNMALLGSMTVDVPLPDVMEFAPYFLEGRVRGRTVVSIPSI